MSSSAQEGRSKSGSVVAATNTSHRSRSGSKNIVENGNSSSSSPGEKQRKKPCARALYSFKGERQDELTFSKGVSILLIRRVNADWLEGELDGKIGIFPANYVTIEVGLPSGKGGSDLANSGHPYARALHDFQGGEDNDLPFQKGDLIKLISWGKGGWLEGSIGVTRGVFPASYVDVIEPLPSPKVTRRSKPPEERQQSSSPVPKPRSRTGSGGSSDLLSVAQQPDHTTSIPIPIPRSTRSVGSLSSAKSPESPLLTRAMVTSPLRGNQYVIESRGGGVNSSDSGGSSSEEVTMGMVQVIQVQQPPPIPMKKRRHSVNNFDSVYMNEELMSFVKEPEPVPKLSASVGSVPRRATSATMDNRQKHRSMADYSSLSLGRGKEEKMGGVNRPPVPKPRTAAKGAPNRLPPLPPPPNTNSPIYEDVNGEEENEQEAFPGASSPSHPLQKVNERMAEVREMIGSQEKLIQSACGLLRVTQDKSKRTQLIAAVESREKTLQSLHQELSLLKEEKVRIQSSSRKVDLPTVPEPPKMPVDKKALKISHRKEVIEEIIRTEKEYCEEIDVCLKYISPLLRKVEDIDCDVLLGNMEDVHQASKQLIAEMEENREQLGKVFASTSKSLLVVYTVYCKNHNVATVALKRYMDDPLLAGKLAEIMQQVKDRTKSWDLGTLLIKPVQRILKYPLLLVQLKKETDENHEDMVNIQKAELNMKEVADAINEAKRRKELVEKYMDPSNKGVNISKSSMKHSMSKKMDRFITAMTQFAGLRTKTVDSKFEDERQKFLDLQEILKSLQKGVQAWSKGVKDTFDSHQKLTVTLVEYCAERPPRQLAKYGEAVYSGLQLAVKSHSVYVETHVLEPLKTTLTHFQEPAFIIHKRDQKLLDYDHVNHELEKAKEAEKITTLKGDRKIAKRTYVAMNQQLLEDLPVFRVRVQEMFVHLLAVFCKARLHFHRKCMEIWKKNVMDSQMVTSSAVIGDIHAQRLSIACQRSLVHLRYIGTSALTATLRTRRSTLSTEASWPASSPEMSPEPTDLELGQILEVLYDFEAQESSVELTVEKGDYVSLVAAHDQLGCGEWWLVQNEVGEGYVPALYLRVVPKEEIPEVLNDSFETVAACTDSHQEQDDSVTLDSFITCSDVSDMTVKRSETDSSNNDDEKGPEDNTDEIDQAINELESNPVIICKATS